MRNTLLSFSLLACQLISYTLGNPIPRPPVVFNVKLTWGIGRPDGVDREMIFTNGVFPAPDLNLEQGDNVEFIVENALPVATTIHFHGIEQIGTPWSDGVPGLSQLPIQPGAKFVYKWTADHYGSYWYHAHNRAQVEDGLIGAIFVKPKHGTLYPFNAITNVSSIQEDLARAVEHPKKVLLGDWSHFTSTQLRNISISANVDQFCSDSILVNGRGQVYCPGSEFLTSLVPAQQRPLLSGTNLTDKGCQSLNNPLAQNNGPHNFDLVPPGLFSGCVPTESHQEKIGVTVQDKWVSLNFISTASIQELTVSVDEHPMWVYEIDGRYIEPQLVDAMTLSHGARHSVLIQLNQPKRDYLIRVAGTGLNQKIFGSATFSYDGGVSGYQSIPSINYGGFGTSANVRFLNDRTVVPFPNVRPSQTADQTVKLLLNRTNTAYTWTLNNNVPMAPTTLDLNPTMLWSPHNITDLTVTTKNDTWVDIILMATKSAGLQPPHPIHRHSTKGHIIGYGQGEFPWPDVASARAAIPGAFNLENPPLRDGFYTLPVINSSTWLAVRYHVVNPGPFLLHCHINPHMTNGMALIFLDGIDKWPTTPANYGPGGNGF